MPTPSISTTATFKKGLALTKQLQRITLAWRDHTPESKFANKTLDQFIELTRSAHDARQPLASLQADIKVAIAERQIADQNTRILLKRVVAGVIGDAGHGPDSPLYSAMGFMTASFSGDTTPIRVRFMQRLNIVNTAWEQLAPATSFSGMTLQQFQEATAPSYLTRLALVTLRSHYKGGMTTRNTADRVTNEWIQRIIAGVKADENFGSDSPLWNAMGYRRKSQRRSSRQTAA